MFDTLIGLASIFWWGGFGWWLRGRHERRKVPYRYSCGKHAIYVESDRLEVVATFAAEHERVHH